MRFAFTFALLCAGCAGAGFPDVIDPREVSSAFGAPSIRRVRDAGIARLPDGGAWKGEEDGVVIPGELLVVEGSDFGRQPTISVGGRATSILARTEGGGVIVRVPQGVPAGDVEVTVAQPKGRAAHMVRVRRLAVVVHGGRLHVLELTKDGVAQLGTGVAVDGARHVRLSSDGAAAYVLASRPDGDRVVAVDLAAPGGARISAELKLSHRAQLITTAADAPVLAVAGEGKLTTFSTANQRQPAPWDALDLPKETSKPRAIELSPDGKVLALLLPEHNQLAICDVESPRAVKLISAVDLLPDEKLPLVRDLAFSSDGETLWVVSGDNERTLPAIQPTRLTAVRLLVEDKPALKNENAPPQPPGSPTKHGARLLSVWRTQSVPGAAAPLKIAIARGQPLASGTTIRMPPEKAAVFVTSLNDALFKLADLTLGNPAGNNAAMKLWNPSQPGQVVRADINGGGGPLFTTSQVLSALDLTPDATRVLATSVRVSPGPNDSVMSLDFGVTVSSVWGAPQPQFVQLGSIAPSELKPPFELGDLRVQP